MLISPPPSGAVPSTGCPVHSWACGCSRSRSAISLLAGTANPSRDLGVGHASRTQAFDHGRELKIGDGVRHAGNLPDSPKVSKRQALLFAATSRATTCGTIGFHKPPHSATAGQGTRFGGRAVGSLLRGQGPIRVRVNRQGTANPATSTVP